MSHPSYYEGLLTSRLRLVLSCPALPPAPAPDPAEPKATGHGVTWLSFPVRRRMLGETPRKQIVTCTPKGRRPKPRRSQRRNPLLIRLPNAPKLCACVRA